MCGIIAILRRAQFEVLQSSDLIAGSLQALAELERGVLGDAGELRDAAAERLHEVAAALASSVAVSRTPAGVAQLLDDRAGAERLVARVREAVALCDRVEARLDEGEAGTLHGAQALERLNSGLLKVRDALWALGRDAPTATRGVERLLAHGGAHHAASVTAALSIQQALAALDRMEVRGRDSAGVHLLCTGHGIDLEGATFQEHLRDRSTPLFEHREIRVAGNALALVYKVAEEIGELGDNVRTLRRAMEEDPVLAAALRSPEIEVAVLGHTRWASVGLITEANAHPLNQEAHAGLDASPYVVAALNGDVDNYADLKVRAGLAFADEITTDAKVIPALTAQAMERGAPLEQAFRETVAAFVGSVAIGLQCADDPRRLVIAQRGSGQALYVGLAEDAFVVASELYGVVELTDRYLRLDGETPSDPERPSTSRGQVLALDGRAAGGLDGLRRWSYDGTELPIAESEPRRAEITTRDVDRGDAPHYLLKEITEAPRSFEKTLRGRVRRGVSGLEVVLDEQTVPARVAEGLRDGSIERILVIGQGTAAVAGQGVAAALRGCLPQRLREIRALPATELSGFGLRPDMADTLVVAISQSGTTTDTNRTVDLVRGRGAAVLAIVNRRNSDLCDKADGVLYTSDGRDIEMSVASTKAFYAQIAAGQLLALGLAQQIDDGSLDAGEVQRRIEALRAMPGHMRTVIEQRPAIDEIARRYAPPKRYWALVGNGLNQIAAQEIRIKLSELCYKSIACDSTEDKKHIDLSSEPLILVCAAGLVGSTADDVAKEVAIYRAHKAIPIVVASEGDQRYPAASAMVGVPRVHPELDFVLAALVGHLFGYAAALAIDALAAPLREIRSSIEHLAPEWLAKGTSADILGSLRARSRDAMTRFFDDLAGRRYDGHLEASTATRLALQLRFALGQMPVEMLPSDAGLTGVGPSSPAGLVEALGESLTRAIDELTRPVDAIKHQAKTVTVGISRSDEALLTVPLVASLMAAGADRDAVSYADLRTLAALDPVVESVVGHTRYSLEGDPSSGDCIVRKLESGGLSRDLVSRTDAQPILRGTKRRVAVDRRVLVARGSADGRLFLLVPEVRSGKTTGLVLLHLRLVDSVAPPVLRGALQGYRERYEQLRDAVMETEDGFREDLLASWSVEDLLVQPINRLAGRWRSDAADGSGASS